MTQTALDYNDELDALHVEINQMRYELKECFRRIHELEISLPPKLIHGILRPMAEMSSVGCQVFFTPSLADQPKANKTVFSLKLQAHINGVRAKPDIDVALYPLERFLESVDNLPCVAAESAFVRQVVTHFMANSSNSSNLLMGMLRKKTGGAGTPYVPSQFCVLDHRGDISEQPNMVFYVNEEVFLVDGWQPGKGTKEKASKWYGSWKAAR